MVPPGFTDLPGIPAAAISPDGQTVATSLLDGTVFLTDIRSGQIIRRLMAGMTPAGLRKVAFSPDGHQLATRDDTGTVRVWDIVTGALLAALNPPVGGGMDFGSLAYSPDGRTLASTVGTDIDLWDTTTWQLRYTLFSVATSTNDAGIAGVTALAFSPDSHALAIALADSITVWDTVAHGKTAVLVLYGAELDALAFSPDGRTLAAVSLAVVASSLTGTISLWDLHNGQQTITVHPDDDGVYTVHQGGVLALSYNRNFATLATYNSATGEVAQLQTDPDIVLRQLCRDTADGSDISPEHWNQLAPGVSRPAVCQTRIHE
jgi:WD40 repeat protein